MRCLEIARRLDYAMIREGTFSNYKLGEAGDEIVNLFRVGLDDVARGWERYCKKWARSPRLS